MNTIRLNKLLATRGVAARRKCDTLIESGAVRVNGEVVTAPGARVIEGRDKITVNGRPLPEGITHRYLMLHKPVGVITTLSDPEGRRTIRDLLPSGGRLYPVGRLDADTSGLLIVTNDGDLAHHLMHPRYGLTKFYRVLLERAPDEGQLKRLAGGVEFEPGIRSAPALVRLRDPVPRGAVIEIALHEGRHRQVRRMCEAVGLTVLGLHRWAYGPLRLGEVARGIWRELSETEVAALRAASARPQPMRGGRGAHGAREPMTRGERDRRYATGATAPITPSRSDRAPAPGGRAPRSGPPRFVQRSEPPQSGPPRFGARREGVRRGTQRSTPASEGARPGPPRFGARREGARRGTQRSGPRPAGARPGAPRFGARREGVRPGAPRDSSRSSSPRPRPEGGRGRSGARGRPAGNAERGISRRARPAARGPAARVRDRERRPVPRTAAAASRGARERDSRPRGERAIGAQMGARANRPGRNRPVRGDARGQRGGSGRQRPPGRAPGDRTDGRGKR